MNYGIAGIRKDNNQLEFSKEFTTKNGWTLEWLTDFYDNPNPLSPFKEWVIVCWED